MTPDRKKAAAAAAGLVGAVTGALGVYTLLVEPYRIELTHPRIPLARLPAVLDGLSILLLADTHVSRWGRREPALLALLESVETPDVIVWAGDFIQGQQGIPHALNMVRETAAFFPGVPTFAILGNAEHKMRQVIRDRFIADLEEIGVQVLVNQWKPLTLRGETITVAGVDDPYYGHSDLEQALAGAPSPRERFTLLLAHSPQIATQAAQAGIDLMLSGHTHGGQVRIPGVGPLKTQNPLAPGFDCGLWDRQRLGDTLGRDPGGDLVTYISRGIGVANVPRISWLAPRFLCPPEVAWLILVRDEEA